MKKNNCKLKIALILKKGGKEEYLYPSVKKMQIFIRNKADHILKKGYLITIRVSYGFSRNAYGNIVNHQNSGTYSNLEGLKWAYQGFIKEYLSEI